MRPGSSSTPVRRPGRRTGSLRPQELLRRWPTPRTRTCSSARRWCTTRMLHARGRRGHPAGHTGRQAASPLPAWSAGGRPARRSHLLRELGGDHRAQLRALSLRRLRPGLERGGDDADAPAAVARDRRSWAASRFSGMGLPQVVVAEFDAPAVGGSAGQVRCDDDRDDVGHARPGRREDRPRPGGPGRSGGCSTAALRSRPMR